MAGYDIIISGGRIVDGTGRPPFGGNVYIAGGVIAAIDDGAGRALDGCGAIVRIDASGLLVCPGFIDIHSHSDKTLLVNPLAESKIQQGVTTEVIGNCGYSLVPQSERNRANLMKDLDDYDLDIDMSWRAPDDYLRAIESAGPSVNVVALVGHGAVRSAVMGYEMAQPDASQMRAMKDLIREAMDEGFAGISTGLIYPPGVYSTTGELVELAGAAAELGGFYATHVRGERERLLDAVGEAIRIGREAGVSVQISHLKAAGRPNWGKVGEALRMIEKARENGLDVTADHYPYTASSTSLGAVLPSWAHAGGREASIARLRDPSVRARIEAEVEARESEIGGWEEICLSSVSSRENAPLEGRFIVDIARERGVKPSVAVTGLLLEERMAAEMIRFSISEDDVREVMRRPFVMVGSDGSALAPSGLLGAGKPHPRNYGTFPRVLGRYAIREQVIPIETAVRKMTSLPAARLGLRDRGIVKEGYAADLVLVDPRRIIDTATFQRPAQYPDGVECVIVNGHLTVRNGVHLGTRQGRVLRPRAGSTL
ncbi:MAG: N-acyl-D-amino-acid deacylase family protein [Ignavibacteriales bacterium]